MSGMRRVFAFFIFCGLLSPLFADTGRVLPADLFLIIDGSAALENSRDEAFEWLCARVVDGLLREGDRLTIWVAGDKAEELYSGTAGSGTKEAVKALIRSITVQGRKSDFSGALREAAKRRPAAFPGDPGSSGDPLCYTLLISGMTAGYTSLTGERELFEFLRYSRFEEFPGWRAVTAASGIEAEVKSAAAAFMRHSGTLPRLSDRSGFTDASDRMPGAAGLIK
jgi:hypothetical protein